METILHSDSDFATVAYLRIKDAQLEGKPALQPVYPTIPPLLSEDFDGIRDAVESSVRSSDLKRTCEENISVTFKLDGIHQYTSKRVGDWVSVANVQCPSDTAKDEEIEHEVTRCFSTLEGNPLFSDRWP